MESGEDKVHYTTGDRAAGANKQARTMTVVDGSGNENTYEVCAQTVQLMHQLKLGEAQLKNSTSTQDMMQNLIQQ